jgi:hydrogenase expression/formation protein HypE
MSDRMVGKPSPTRLRRLLADSFGAPCAQVLVGPGTGLDAAVLELEDGRVMAVAEDPIFPAPGLPLDIMGWFTVHIGASDVAVTGVVPAFMTYTLLLPGASPESDARTVITSISEAARDLGITILGGHTGWYDAVTVPIVGGVAVWGFAEADQWISPGGAQDGDVILMTKGPSIEAAALLGILYRDRLRGRVDDDLLARACGRADEITVVKDALTAFAAGGVHAMHDATEGGVVGGLWEMAASSGLGLSCDFDAVPVPDDIAAVAGALGFDPWAAISEGTLLLAAAPEAADDVTAALARAGIPCHRLGRFSSNTKSLTARRDGRTVELGEPQEDPFWALFFAGLGGAG